MALTNAERQRRFRERRAAGVPGAPRRRPASPSAPSRSRGRRRTDGRGRSSGPTPLLVLRRLQGEYESWSDGLPEGLADSKTGQLLEGVCEVDLDALDVELPRGFGRD